MRKQIKNFLKGIRFSASNSVLFDKEVLKTVGLALLIYMPFGIALSILAAYVHMSCH